MMPAQAELNQPNASSANHFEQPERRISEYTARQIATLSSRLEKQLGPEYLSSRPGSGGAKVHYVAADKVISLANEVFGFNGWSSSILNVQVDFVDEVREGKFSIGLSVIVRVTLKDGTFHEDVGYGTADNYKGKAAAFEKAKKEGATDAMKRALRVFGNVLGNCIYDKDYLGRISKIKVQPTKWSVDKLHRHPDYATVKEAESEVQAEPQSNGVSNLCKKISLLSTSTEAEDEFGGDVFDVVDFAVTGDGHPDEVMLDASFASNPPQISRPPAPQPRTPGAAPRNINPNQQPNRMGPPQPKSSAHPGPVVNGQNSGVSRPQQQAQPKNQANANPQASGPQQGLASDQTPSPGFYTARAAPLLQAAENAQVPNAPTFNPHAESPSIRKTSGIDHTKSKPVNKDALGLPTPAPAAPNAVAPATNSTVASRPNVTNPQLDHMRKIGMPTSPTPLQNRGSYKPPGPAAGKRVFENTNTTAAQQTAQVLRDMSPNKIIAAQSDGGGDAKRPKLNG